MGSQTDEPATDGLAEIDLASYQKPDLIEEVIALADFPDVAVTLAKWTFVAVLLTLALTWVAFADAHWGWATFAFIWGVLAGLLCGLFFGFLRAVSSTLESILRVLDLLLELSEEVTHDVADVQAGERAMPGASQIAWAVHDGIIITALRAAARSQMGFVALPFVALYDRVLAKALRKLLQVDVHAEEVAEELAQMDPEELAELGERAATILGQLEVTRERIASVGTALVRGLTVPLYALFALVVLLMAAPSLAAWWVSSRTASFLPAVAYDRDCETDADCVLVEAGEQCGPCPPCPVHAVSKAGARDFREEASELQCEPGAFGVECEPCTLFEAYCEDGTCASSMATPTE